MHDGHVQGVVFVFIQGCHGSREELGSLVCLYHEWQHCLNLAHCCEVKERVLGDEKEKNREGEEKKEDVIFSRKKRCGDRVVSCGQTLPATKKRKKKKGEE